MIVQKFTNHYNAFTQSRIKKLVPLLGRSTVTAGVKINKMANFDGRVDELSKRACKHYPVILVRDCSYLTWRFTSRPDADYTILLATQRNNLLGYLVFRSIERDGLKIGYLVDFLVERKSPPILFLLIKEAIKCLRRDGVAIIICRATKLSYRQTLFRLGFFPWYFEPPCYFNPHIDFPNPTLSLFGDTRHWYLTMGDGDLEMSF